MAALNRPKKRVFSQAIRLIILYDDTTSTNHSLSLASMHFTPIYGHPSPLESDCCCCCSILLLSLAFMPPCPIPSPVPLGKNPPHLHYYPAVLELPVGTVTVYSYKWLTWGNVLYQLTWSSFHMVEQLHNNKKFQITRITAIFLLFFKNNAVPCIAKLRDLKLDSHIIQLIG